MGEPVRIQVQAYDFAFVIDSSRLSSDTLREGDGSEFLVRVSEADINTAAVRAPSGSHTGAIDAVEGDATGPGDCLAFLVIDGGQFLSREDHAMLNTTRVHVVSGDHARSVDPVGIGFERGFVGDDICVREG